MLGGRSCAVLLAVVLLEVVVLACSVLLLPLLELLCPSLAASALATSNSTRAQIVQMCMVSSVFVLFCVVGSCMRRDVRGERGEAGAGVRKVDT